MSDVQAEKQSSTDDHLDQSAQSVDEEARTSKLTSSHRNDDITEEEENKLLADDDDDLDVIDCYTEDFDSDMENDFCQKEAQKDKERECKGSVEANQPCSAKEDVRDAPQTELKVAEKEPDEMPEKDKGPEMCSEKIVPNCEDDDDDADVIQIDDDISDIFIEASNSVPNDAKPQISLGVKNETEKERILSEPLVKQMIIPQICVSDEENDKNSIGSQESLSLQIDHFVEKVSEIMGSIQETQKARKDSCEAKNGSTLNSSGETSEGIYGCHVSNHHISGSIL